MSKKSKDVLELVVPDPFAMKKLPKALATFRALHGREPECLVLAPNALAIKDRHDLSVEMDVGADPNLVGLCFEKVPNKSGEPQIHGVMWFQRSEWE